MDLFGIGGAELIVLLFLAGVLLGPRRLARLGRDAGKILRQIRALSGDLTKELNRELDLLEAAERKSGLSPEPEEHAEAKLPQAYRRFREEFPGEGKLDHLTGGPTRGKRPSSREKPPVTMPGAQPEGADPSKPETSDAA